MTTDEAIQALKFNKEMILFNPTTGETTEPELLNKDNREAYDALEMAIEALEEKKVRTRCDVCKRWVMSYCENWKKRARSKKK